MKHKLRFYAYSGNRREAYHGSASRPEANLQQASSKLIPTVLQDIVAVIRICEAYRRSYTLLVKDELIFLASHLFQAQIQICCCSIEELITKIV